MHTVTFSEPVSFHGMHLMAGVSYLVANSMAGSLLTNRQLVRCGDGHQRPLYRLVRVVAMAERPLEPGRDYNERDIWIFRMGGFGDVLMATPTIREIKRRWPRCRVNFVTTPQYAPALTGVDCGVHTGFLPLEKVGPEDPLIFFEGVIEDNPRAHTVHAVDLLAERAGVELVGPDAKRLSYLLAKWERRWALANFPRNGRRRIGIQPAASSGVRTYDQRLLVRVIQGLLAEDVEVVLFGQKGKVECDLAGVVNLADQDLDFRQSVAVLSTCDAVFVPDSSLHHVAGAIGVPAVVIFGSFPSALRVIPGADVTVLEARGDCAPCHHHESGNGRWPAHGPCDLAKFCTVLASIPPERVVKACLEKVAGSMKVEGKRPVAVYDFLNHKIGDTVAAAYLLAVWRVKKPDWELRIVDRGALSVRTYWPGLATDWQDDFPPEWEALRRLNFEFGNLWIAAPSAFQDVAILPNMMRYEALPSAAYDVGMHCLQDAAYNTGRNHSRDQFIKLKLWMEEALRLRVYWVPEKAALDDIIGHISHCRMWIGGDTGFSHCFAAMHPDRPLIAIYGDDSHDRAGFEDERQRMRAWWEPGSPAGLSSPWCSDPLSLNLHKFVMTDHLFDMNAVKKAVEANAR